MKTTSILMRLGLLWVCLLTFLLAGCGEAFTGDSGGKDARGSALDQMVARGEMRVGYVSWNPAVIKNPETGELTGIFPDMVNYMAETLKLHVRWKETTLANFAAGLQSRQYDFSVGPTFITIPRSVPVAFTQPVAYVGNSAVVNANTPPPSSPDEIAARSMRVAVLQGQAMDEFFKRRYSNVELLILSGSDLTAPLAAVSTGRADIGFMNTVTVARYAEAHQDVKPIFMGDDQLEMLPLAWGTRHQDSALQSFLESSIIYLKSTRKLERIQARYDIQLLYDTPELHIAQP
jgi:ABC-type amino acid transport substrate-binding protein